MTIVVHVEDSPLEQVTKQLNKLVEVIKIVELDGAASVARELLLVKVRADAATRGQVLDAVQLFKAKVVDVAPDAVTIEVDRQRRQAQPTSSGCSSPSGSASSSSPAWSPSAAARRSITERTLRPVAVPAPPPPPCRRPAGQPSTQHARHDEPRSTPNQKESPRG